MMTFSLAAMIRERGGSLRKPIVLRETPPSIGGELDLIHSLTWMVSSITRWARENLTSVARAERAAFRASVPIRVIGTDVSLADDAGQNARRIIEEFRREAERLAAATEQRVRQNINRAAQKHTRDWVAAVKVGAKIDVSALLRDDDLVDFLSVRSEQFNALIRNLSDDIRSRIERETLGSIFEGRSNADVAKRLSEIEGIGRGRARLIARDQASKLNGAMNEFRQRQAGVTHYKWRSMMDPPRARVHHMERNGKVFAWDRPPPGGHPGREINCFPGSTRVTFADGCHKLWRRQYVGPLVSVVTSEGALLEATPNHPVLTARGWLAVNDLQEGDYLVKPVVDGGLIGEYDQGKLQVCIEDLFEAGALRQGLHSAALSPSDFHGDGAEGHVDVVLVHGRLPDGRNASGDELVEDLLLAVPDGNVGISALDADRPLAGGAHKMRAGEGPNASVGRSGEITSLGFGHLAHANKVGCRSTAARDVVLVEDARDYGPGNGVASGERLDAFASAEVGDHVLLREAIVPVGASLPTVYRGVEIRLPTAERIGEIVAVAGQQRGHLSECGSIKYELLRVAQKSIREFAGHVYNLESSIGWYIAEGAVVHNCRCRGLAVIVDTPEEAEELLPEAPVSPDDAKNLIGRVSRTMSSDVLNWSRDAILTRHAETRRAIEALGSLRAGVAREAAEDLFTLAFGFDAKGQDIGMMSGLTTLRQMTATYETLLFAAIRRRLSMIEELLEHAAETAAVGAASADPDL